MNLNNKSQLEAWITSRDWYQSMVLSSGIRINGKVATFERERFLAGESFTGKSVLDVGCNSGQFCLYAKGKGAERVTGIDPIPGRIEEAKVLAEVEKLPIDFRVQSLFNLPVGETYDIVFCFAVVTEIQDLFGALTVLRRVMNETLYLELDLAKPLLYLSRSKLRPGVRAGRVKGLAEVRSSNGILVFSPSLEVLKEFFGPEYAVELLGKSVRYDMVRVRRAS